MIAAHIDVENLADAGSGSLREAVLEAEASRRPERIEFAKGLHGKIRLNGSLPTITGSLEIDGPGSDRLTIEGDGASRLFYLASNNHDDVTISGLSLTSGSASEGGAIDAYGTHLTLARTVISGSEATSSGGGINITHGSLTLRDSALRKNTSRFPGGAIEAYESRLDIDGSTITGNEAGGNGGGLDLTKAVGQQKISNSTITGNSADGDGGGVAFGSYDNGALELDGTRISGNQASGDGGGLYSGGGAAPSLRKTTITGNQSDGDGDDIWPTPPPAHVHRNHRTLRAARQLWGGSVSSTLTSSGIAIPPADAPPAVQGAISAANLISRTPYVWGGGHGSFISGGYDCSGAVSFALYGAGLLGTPMDSSSLERYGAPGPGRWITIYANPGHAFAVIAGLRWDTVGDQVGSPAGFVVRHPPGY